MDIVPNIMGSKSGDSALSGACTFLHWGLSNSLKYIFLIENVYILIQISLKIVYYVMILGGFLV